MRVLKLISTWLSSAERWLIVMMLVVMVTLAFLQVILRNVFATGLFWADPFLRHMVLWIGFLGASLATQQERHINLDIVQRYLSPRVVNIIRVATNQFAGIVALLLANAGATFLASEIDSADVLLTIGSVEFPAWWFQVIIPVGFGLMSFRFFIKAIEHAVRVFRPDETVEPPINVPVINP